MMTLNVYLFAWSWMGTRFNPPNDALLSEARGRNLRDTAPYVLIPAAVNCLIVVVLVRYRRVMRPIV